MYTRSYDEKLGIVIPESYSGSLLRDESNSYYPEEHKAEPQQERPQKNPWKKEELHSEEKEESTQTFSFIKNLPFRNFFGDIFKKKTFSLQNIGTEEILIIGTAAFLMFSKDGDKECANMLLLLLFLS